MKKIVTLFATVLLLYGCGSVPLTGRKQMLLVSDSEVLSSSLTQYSEYIKSAPISSNATKKAMVTRVGKKIAAATEQYLENNGMSGEVRNFSWEFNLVKDNQVNAFCMPGGKIVVYEGLMNLVSSDDELAVVIGHEVAHAVAKHSNAYESAAGCTIRSENFWGGSQWKIRRHTESREYSLWSWGTIRCDASILTQT